MQIDLAFVLPALVAASHFYTCAQDGLDTVKLDHEQVVFFLPSNSTITLYTCTYCGHCPLQLALVVFYLAWSTSALTNYNVRTKDHE